MIRIITTEVERGCLCPDRKFRQIEEVLGKENVCLHIMDESNIDSKLETFDKEDIILSETKNYKILDAVRWAGMRNTAERIQTVKTDEDKLLLKMALAYKVRTPRTADPLGKNPGFCNYFVKPLMLEDSIGIDGGSLCDSFDDAKARAMKIREVYGYPAICEEYISGEDVTCAVVSGENGLYSALPIIINPNAEDPFLSYNAKNDNKETYTSVNDEELAKRIKEAAIRVARIIGINHYARIDMRVMDGIPYVLEVNCYPGLSNTGYMFRCFQICERLDYKEFLQRILATAR